MRKNIIFTIAIILASTMVSCENFRDNNGELGGMWQLTQWRTRSTSGEIDSLVANNIFDANLPNTKKLYYCIHRDVIQLRDAATFFNKSYFCELTVRNDSIILGNVVDVEGNLIVDKSAPNSNYEVVQDFGVPSNGCFHIDILDNNSLQLGMTDDILIFRKY